MRQDGTVKARLYLCWRTITLRLTLQQQNVTAIKVKQSLAPRHEHVWGSGGTAHHSLKIYNRQRWIKKFTPRSAYIWRNGHRYTPTRLGRPHSRNVCCGRKTSPAPVGNRTAIPRLSSL